MIKLKMLAQMYIDLCASYAEIQMFVRRFVIQMYIKVVVY